jgi:hypothetical protein
MHILLRLIFALTGCCGLVGDIRFQAQRRFWTETARAPSYAYLFTDPQPGTNPALGVLHTSEIPYIFGNLSTTTSPKVANLSSMMLDYWISFAVSLTPNDGKGASSAFGCISISVFLPLILHLGPYWETYENSKVWLGAFVIGKYSTCLSGIGDSGA